MGLLIYSAIASLDGYVADAAGNFDWAMPDREVHEFANDLERGVGTNLYGRRMYETMQVWESPEMDAGVPPYVAEYARIWRETDKIVYSATLESVATSRTRLERQFDPSAIREMKEHAPHDMSIGGPTLAASALKAGLVDECYLIVAPTVVGGGLPAFPDLSLSLSLMDERKFGNGMVYLRYRIEPR